MPDFWSALQQRVRRQPGAPVITYVNAAAGERVELSATTLENAAAKIANALRDEFDLEPGAMVGLDLPVHWQRSAWCAGIWAARCALVVDKQAFDEADLVVIGDDAERPPISTPVVAASLHPFGLPISHALPDAVTDVTMAVRTQPDAYLFEPAQPADTALVGLASDAGRQWTQEQVWEAATDLGRRWSLDAGGRLLVTSAVDRADGWLAALAVPLATGSSVVLAARGDDGLVSQEQVTAIAAP